MLIPVVDIFAGPGGLGEGFSAFLPRKNSKQSPFKIAISAEAEVNAAKTLRLRAFFRQFPVGDAPESYYDYVAGLAGSPWTEETRLQWEAAGEEARQLTLGEPEHDDDLHGRISVVAQKGQPWILIGGPPCQAYSLVGRSRNRGKAGYRAEEDNRHFLYTHYLKILREFRPAAFVMENVKGILSSKVGQEQMFPRILDDLHQPGGKGGPRYRLVSMVVPSREDRTFPDGKDFVLKAEELGVPQARHRVVLLGLLEELELKIGSRLELRSEQFSVTDAIGGLPPLRSGVTDIDVGNWSEFARRVLNDVEKYATDGKTATRLRNAAKELRKRDPGTGGRWMPATQSSTDVPPHLEKWLLDPRLGGILNHEVREHMTADLRRYAFASAFAQAHGRSPRGAKEFPVELHPRHKNWQSGKFVDRFKAQLGNHPSSTITSHLSKDGHYFIHPDTRQLRSLSVREAARLQTFPDNYFFEGKRGAQFKQVGNAVPPWMARQIAAVVYSYLTP